jgi:3-isopropylmalate/(R)-2-methylmalate dehydratase small subunit
MTSQIQQIQGRAIPLVGSDIDTDRIIPARFLRCVTFDGLGEHVFADDRAQLAGQHAFDQPAYQGATILLVNRNFGCGSSREHAPQAIAKWGIRAIVGVSFAEIFAGNCLAMGVPCVSVDDAAIEVLQAQIQANPGETVTIDLVAQTITCGNLTLNLSMAEGPLRMLISGQWDACGQLVAQAPQIKATADRLAYVGW